MGSKSPKTTTQQVVNDPWGPQQPYLKDTFQLAATAYNLTPKAAYTGDLIAGPNAQMLAALDLAESTAQGARNLGAGTRQLSEQLAAGLQASKIKPWSTFADYDASSVIPALQGAVNPVFQDFVQRVIPQFQSRSIMEGAYGGNRAEVLTPQAMMQDFARTVADTGAQLAFQDFQALRGGMPGLYGMVPQLAGAGYDLSLSPAETLLGAGQMRRGFAQDDIQEALARYEMQQNVPWIGLDRYISAIQGAPSFQSSLATTRTPTPSPIVSGLKGAAGGALTAGALAQAFPGITALAGPWGLAGGAILGALGGGFLG